MKLKSVAIVGVGLMGGSLAAAIRRKFPGVHVTGISRSRSALQHALRKKWIHEGFRDLGRGVCNADLIVLCTPVDTLIPYLTKIDNLAKKGAVVTDVGSVKGEAVCWAHGQKFRNIEFIGAHPMAGSHAKGVSAAHAGLYDHSYSFLICDGNKKRNSYCLVKQFWRKICSRIIEIDARQHDRIVAEISHLPHIVAACLVLSVRDESLSFAASGFSDATRIAQSHPSIWLPIFDANRKEIIRAIKIFEGQIRAFKSALFPGNKRVLKGMVLQASRKRSQI